MRNYIRWRWRSNALTFFLIPFEWLRWLLNRIAGRRTTVQPPLIQKAEPSSLQIKIDNVASRTKFARTHFGDQVSAIIETADAICNGHLRLATGIELDFVRPNWRPTVADIEHLYCLNRWLWGVTLAKAWSYTQEPRFVEQWIRLWRDWSARNPASSTSPVWESYSVSERIVNWCESLLFLWGAPAFESARADVSAALAQHAEWLAAHLETASAHNHLINNARAVFVYGAFFGNAAFQKAGWEILERELFRQVLPDGMLAEQSTHYHLLLTRTYVQVYLLARRDPKGFLVQERLYTNSMPPTSDMQSDQAKPLGSFTERVKQMLVVSAALIRSDGSIPIIGDFSPDTDVASLVGMIGAGQIACGLANTIPLTENALWCLDKSEIPATVNPPSRSLYLPDAGYWIYNTLNVHLTFHVDPRGEIVRHGHADALNVTLWANGGELIVDTGNASYMPDVWLDYFRGATAHNIVTVDGLPPFLRAGFLRELFSADYGRVTVTMFPPQQVDCWTWCQAEHTGYDRLGEPIRLRRRVLIAHEYVWITDWIESQRKHTIEANWHWGLNKIAERIAWFADAKSIMPNSISGQTAPMIQGWRAPAYGRKEPALTIQWQTRIRRPLRLDLIVGLDLQLSNFDLVNGDKEKIITDAWSDEFVFSDRELKGQRCAA
ncbi:MAG: alginate lyase family protein [Chloroflexi bacterium]|nr:alginate lyase family protein [Chloroflexota bacterium]